ncbi:uncharacterized protein EpC_27980 [Erwinia pyrifoliae Ep1/96]|nr:uncharacterized protein EpC_27980 [Erwinia pyrifoliae Ep1/96]
MVGGKLVTPAIIFLTITPDYLADNAYYPVQLSRNHHPFFTDCGLSGIVGTGLLLISNVFTALIARLNIAGRPKSWRKYA